MRAQSTVRLSDEHVSSFKSKRTELSNKSDHGGDEFNLLRWRTHETTRVEQPVVES